MEILSVRLKNFKSHRDRVFSFQPGTNAICGENGAGKTSILEAIAWVLFNYRGAYNKDDLIHNGAATAQASIAFVSSFDQRTYEVTRCTRAGYTVFDPQLGEKLDYSRIEEEVVPWLRSHFGVAPGTDLGRLFANTIGVPQGTFTADFLLPSEKRKPVFDAILKVEEYRQANQQLLTLERFSKVEMEQVQRQMARYEDELQDAETLSAQQAELKARLEQVQAQLAVYQQRLVVLQETRDRLSAQATQLQQATTEMEKLTARSQTQTQRVEQLQVEFVQAQTAAEVCTAHRSAYQSYVQAEAVLKELEQQRRQQQQLIQQRQRAIDHGSDRVARLATLAHQLQQMTQTTAEIATLQPQVQRQTAIEQEVQALAQTLQTCQSWRQTRQSHEQRLRTIGDRLTQIAQKMEAVAQLQASVAQIPELEKQRDRAAGQLSRVDAALHFREELRKLVKAAISGHDRQGEHLQTAKEALSQIQTAVPSVASYVTVVLASLQSSQVWTSNLVDELEAALEEIEEQTDVDKLKIQLEQVNSQIKEARQHQVEYLKLDALRSEQESLQRESQELMQQIENLQKQLEIEASTQAQQTELTQQLAELEDPRSRVKLLQQQVKNQTKIQTQHDELSTAINEANAAIAEIDQQLSTFTQLETEIEAQQQIRETHREAYQIYLEHQQMANSRRQRSEQLQEATEQLRQIEQTLTELGDRMAVLSQDYNPEVFAQVQAEYQEASNQKNYLSGSLPEMTQRLADFDRQLAKVEILRTQRQAAEADLKQRSKTDRFIKFARKAYKEAGPRITERYVQSISQEADRLFRELLNRPNVGLTWTREYEILVQEGAHTRRLINLSGGEQMCAALAVRLALLKVLADIDIAFFDEPTTNMDRARREQLAEAIANIKTFRQLFVISHDDTFEKVTENIILVERDES